MKKRNKLLSTFLLSTVLLSPISSLKNVSADQVEILQQSESSEIGQVNGSSIYDKSQDSKEENENPPFTSPSTDVTEKPLSPTPDLSPDSNSSQSNDKSNSQESLPQESETKVPSNHINEQAQKDDEAVSTSLENLVSGDNQVVDGNKTSLLNNSTVETIRQFYYVTHWTGQDAYSHYLLSHRYGIRAEQLDGFLKATGIHYDSQRINGAKLLEWEKKSGLDVRAIVAIAMQESSFGTEGVATLSGANMFGYGAVESNPEHAKYYSDDEAIIALTQDIILKQRNTSFECQDQKAQAALQGKLNPLTDGGVYFTDTTGSGERRAAIMESLDEWIDQHGGTPEIPESLNYLQTANLKQLPEGYSLSVPFQIESYVATTYAYGQCTWWCFNRAKELGYSFDPYMGNGSDWQFHSDYDVSHEPKIGSVVSFLPGQAGADSTYGHVAVVEDVKEDGSILISESNALGLGIISYRVFTAEQAIQLTYVTGHKID